MDVVVPDLPLLLTTAVGNTPTRCLYDSLGGGPASQGPTVNYWFLVG